MGVFGKWHLSGSNIDSTNGATHVRETGVPVFRGALGAAIPSFFDWRALDADGRATPMTTYATTATTDFATEFITKHRATRPDDPWFVDVSYNAAHAPFQVPPRDLHRVDVGGMAPGTGSATRAVYHAMIQAMDTEIGRLMKVVDLSNTLVIYIGDNGTPAVMKDPTAGVRGSKQSVYEGGVRVPLVMAGAGVTRRNQRDASLVVSSDLFDTIAATAGIPAEEIDRQINDSVSLHPLLLNASGKTGRNFGFTELCNGAAIRRYAIRDTRYKLLYDNGEWGFYDLESDPREASNLFDAEKPKPGQASLMAQIDALKARATSGCFER
jgi:arylsulfatase A-like enzyme